MLHLLLIDDDPLVVPEQVRRAFPQSTHRVTVASHGAEGLEIVRRDPPSVVLLDLHLPDQSGLEVYERIREIDARIPVIFVTMAKTADTAIEAMKQGAFNYLHKPLDLEQLRTTVAEAFEVADRMQSPVTLAEEAPDSSSTAGLFGSCRAMLEIYKSIGRVAAQDVTVLVTGESGTGKELVARAIYQHSARSKAPFLALNCAAIPESLLESELFGHEKGAFTGADRRRVGKFEQCRGGTIFLDEIGDMPLPLQAKILRLLQEQTFERVGGNETIRTDVRIIAATHRDLKARAAEDKFRSDLYYRLGVFTIHLPALRERGDDLRLLVRHYIRRFSAELGRQVEDISPEAMDILVGYTWPGNIRELQSVLKQALLQASGRFLLPAFVPELTNGDGLARRSPPSAEGPLSAGTPSSTSPPTSSGAFFPRRPTLGALASAGAVAMLELPALEDFIQGQLSTETTDLYAAAHREIDKILFLRVLEHTRGNIRDAARVLGIARQTMRVKMRAIEGLSTNESADDEGPSSVD